MSEFFKKLVEELRTREKMLEDHSTHSALEGGTSHKAELDRLRGMLNALSRKIELMEPAADADWDGTKETLRTDLKELDSELHEWIGKIKSAA